MYKTSTIFEKYLSTIIIFMQRSLSYSKYAVFNTSFHGFFKNKNFIEANLIDCGTLKEF